MRPERSSLRGLGGNIEHSRHPSDALRAAVGIGVIFVATLAVRRDSLTVFEENLFALINDVPDAGGLVLGPIMQFGNFFAAPVVGAGLALAARRFHRAGLDVAVAGSIAWVAAKLIKAGVDRPRPGGLIEDIGRVASLDGLGFVSGHTAVAAAIVTSAAPYLPRTWRRLLWLLPWVVGLGRIFYGAHLPLDIVGGAALGWTVGATFHLLFGAPHRSPSLTAVTSALGRLGYAPRRVTAVEGSHRGSFPFVAQLGDETVFVKMLDPEPRHRDWIYRLARQIWHRAPRDEAALLDHAALAYREASHASMARRSGVRTPHTLSIAPDGSQVWVVQEYIAGTTLASTGRSDLSDELLEHIWELVKGLRRAEIAHRDLVGSNILVDAEHRPWLVDFAHAIRTTDHRVLDNDLAELLTTVAIHTGPQRAVESARRALGQEALSRLVPELQPLALGDETRTALAGDGDLLAQLAEAIGGTDNSTATEEPHRSASAVALVTVMAIVSAVTLVAIADLSELGDSLGGVQWRWIGVASVAAAAGTMLTITGIRDILRRPVPLSLALNLAWRERANVATSGRKRASELLVPPALSSGMSRTEAQEGIARWLHLQRFLSVAAILVVALAWLWERTPISLPGRATAMFAVLGLAVAVELVAFSHRGPTPQRLGSEPGELSLASGRSFALATLVEYVALLALTEALGGVAVLGAALSYSAARVVWVFAPAGGSLGARPVVTVIGLSAAGMAVSASVAVALIIETFTTWLPMFSVILTWFGHLRWPGRTVQPPQR